jgi:hypothetical protein
MRPSLKVISINALFFFVLFNAVIWLICIGYSIYGVFNGYKLFSKSPPEANLPHYAHLGWAETYFREAKLRETEYVSFIGWRSKHFSGKAITIFGPYGQRRTVGQADPDKPTVYFFGGSSMWGTGVDDASTIPSLFTKISRFPSQNFGQTGYTAHQSLVLLIQVLQDGHRPDIVVFYDGGNDVTAKCRRELNPWSDEREAKIAAALKYCKKQANGYGISYLVSPLYSVMQSFVSRQSVRQYTRNTGFDCDTNKLKAEKIAENLIEDWKMAKKLVELYNGKFIAILQPISFYSHTLDRGISEEHKPNFDSVYPLIKKKMQIEVGQYDLTDELNRSEYIYTSFAHLGPRGNEYVARRIFDLIKILQADVAPNNGMPGRQIEPLQ